MPVVTGAARVQDAVIQDTYIDRTVALPPGDYTALGIYMPNPASIVLKVGREISPTSIEMIVSSPWQHPGGGMQDKPLTFTIPGTGIYRMGAYANLVSCGVSGAVARTTRQGDHVSGIQSNYHSMNGQTVVMRATYGEGDPPPPPPAGLTGVLAAQSNGGNLIQQAGGVLSSLFLAVTGQSITILDRTHDGSGVDLWGPNTAFRTELMATPASFLIWGQFEADCSAADKAISWGKKVRSIIEEYRSIHGAVPVFILYPFANSNNRPYWWDVALAAELLCDPRYGLPDCTLIRNGMLVGTIDDGIHLDQPRLESWARDIAVVIARRFFPTIEIRRAS